MNMWQKILPCHKIFYPKCQKKNFKYFLDIRRIFKKRFGHAYLFMLTLIGS